MSVLRNDVVQQFKVWAENEVICVHLIGGINTQGAVNGVQTSFVSEKRGLLVATRID